MYTRRDFIIKVFRNISLVSLGVVSGYLLFREKSEEVCDFNFVCQNCQKRKSCNLPEAKQIKEEANGKLR